MQVTTCRICGSPDLRKIFSLGNQPAANNLLSSKDQVALTYPLELLQCAHCTLIQLSYVVPKERMYDTYFYIPSVSQTNLRHFEELSKSLVSDLGLKTHSFVVDIGGSDGSFSSYFEKLGMKVLNIEPAKNMRSTVPRWVDYFSLSAATNVVAKYGKAKLVTATNSFAHIDDIHEYLAALDILLDDDGVFFAQFPDVRNLLKENQFDTIYHEHLSYFTYEPLHHLFAVSPFELYRIDSNTIHGGSMQIYVRRRKPILDQFIRNADTIRKELRSYLSLQKLAGKNIAAFGAAAKGMVLLNYCELDASVIDYIADGTPYKQGKYAPGVNIPIVPEEELLKRKPDIVLILAWNFKEEIMEKLKGRGYTFVVPIPKLEVLYG